MSAGATRLALLLALVALLALAPGASASPAVFWSNEDGNSIARVGLDGLGGGALAVGAATVNAPAGVAIDAANGRIYWANANGNTISWAALDGSGGGDLAISGVAVFSPSGVAIDPVAGKLYWANGASISQANLDGSEASDVPTGGATVVEPSGVAIAPNTSRIYWASTGGGPEGKGTISYASLDGSGAGDLPTGSATVNVPSGVAVDGGRVFWANVDGIAYANADGSGGANVPTAPVGVSTGVGIAFDPATSRIYWGNAETDTLGSTGFGIAGSGALLGLGSAPASGPGFPALLHEPVAAAPPTLSREGGLLSCTTGVWAPDLSGAFLSRAPHGFRYEWLRSGEVVAGATGASLRPAAGGLYRCRVTAVNAAGGSEQTSAGAEVGLALSAFVPKRQKAGKLRVRAGCQALPCRVKVFGYAKVFGKTRKKGGPLKTVHRRFKLRPRTVSVGADTTRLVKIRFKNNRTTLRQIKQLTKRAPKKLRKRSRLFVKLVATDSGGARTKLSRHSVLVP